MAVIDIPREAIPLPDTPGKAPLSDDRPAPGTWVMGVRWPLFIWWRCPRCQAVVPIEPDEVDERGLVVNGLAHIRGNKERGRLCTWSDFIRLRDYNALEHKTLVERANRTVAGDHEKK